MSPFNEETLEKAIIELLEHEDYIHTHGSEIHKEVSDVLLRDDLRIYLKDKYFLEGITPLEVERVIAKLTANVGESVYENNVTTYRLIKIGRAHV